MRFAVLALSMSIATPAGAAPWADWVGDHRGALTWRGCTVVGERTATVAIDAVDGVLQVDLTAAGAALRTYSLQAGGAGWEAHDGDVVVRLTRTRANEVELAVDIDSGCTLRGRLARPSARVAGCDRLLGWARIEDRCTKTTDRLEDLAALLSTKWKPADAARCAARADKLALAMVTAGCAPHPDPQIGTRATECRALADATAKLARCGRVPREIMQRLAGAASALSAASQSADRATLPYVERQCKDARIDTSATAVQFGCRP